jgi:hypothetical protein
MPIDGGGLTFGAHLPESYPLINSIFHYLYVVSKCRPG